MKKTLIALLMLIITLSHAESLKYILLPGTVIDTTIQWGADCKTDFPNEPIYIMGIVSHDVHDSASFTNTLIPAGAFALGKIKTNGKVCEGIKWEKISLISGNYAQEISLQNSYTQINSKKSIEPGQKVQVLIYDKIDFQVIKAIPLNTSN